MGTIIVWNDPISGKGLLGNGGGVIFLAIYSCLLNYHRLEGV